MTKIPEEWFKQAAYDLKTAEIMLENRRFIYAVFMCHLTIEKALKGLYQFRLNEVPPKVHNLIYLVEKVGLSPSEKLYDAIFELNRVSIPTRYPDDLTRMKSDYTKKNTSEIVSSSKEVLKWLKNQL
ncbi:MAG: DNA-binding protein [Deltaproteobacteria bacterium HGW-Deltaproteobacteria-12]|jgi:HEPN domain-containing protein|nr:MAG: DNA-binding protein [Deltaproteobacteria bacterium HGW-Deltaproteobacteria-12]